MEFSVTILGSNSALPSNGRHPTAQILSIKEHLILIDCGEGTQMQMSKYKIRTGKIEYIFISHLHGDHIFGLIGLITSYNLNQRQKPLTVFGPKGLEEIIQLQLQYSDTRLRFDLHFKEIYPVNGKIILDHPDFTVATLKMNHRIPCCGFFFREKNVLRKIKVEALEQYRIPVDVIPSLKEGKDFVAADGTVIPNNAITDNPPVERSYAFCTDTTYQEDIIPYIQEADLLYHEATFTADLNERAQETFHSTSAEAATIAKKARVKKLIIGHFSARYENLNLLLNEARVIFPATELAEEGVVFEVERK
jgi:ribonuclease Z